MLLTLTLALVPALPQDVELVPILRTGDPSPDGNGVFDRPVLDAVVNASGDVALAARTVQTELGILDDDVLIVANEDGWEVLGREGAPSPDGDGFYGSFFPTTPYVAVFSQPSFSPLGDAISVVSILGGSFVSPATGVVSAHAGEVTQVLTREAALYGGGSVQVTDLFVGFLAGNSSDDTVLFGRTSTNGAAPVPGMFRFAPGSLDPVLEVGDTLPGEGAVVGFHEGWVTLNELGRAAFVAGLEPSGSSSDPDGTLVTADPDGTLRVLAREGSPAPGGGTWGNLDLSAGSARAVLNALGQVAFSASVVGTPPLFLESGFGIFVADPAGNVSVLAKDDDPSPDGDGQMLSVLNPNLGDGGHVAFLAVFEYAQGVGTDAGIVAGLPGDLEVVARTGMEIPDGGGRTFGNSYYPGQINAVGTVAFGAVAEGELAAGIYAKRRGGPIVTLVEPGDVLGGKVVETANIPAVQDPGGNGAINDSDEVVFTVYFTDGDAGVYLARLCQASGPGDACHSLVNGPRAISLADGGLSSFAIDAGPAHAGSIHWVVGSITGIEPGFPTPPVQVPLNFDKYFALTLKKPNSALLPGSLGFLDGDGRGTAGFALAPGQGSGIAGLVLHHAALVLDPGTLALEEVTNPVPVTLVP